MPQDTLDGDPHFSAVVRFGVAYEQAVLTWLEDLGTLPGLSG